MPCEKEYTKLIPRIYKRKYEDIGMFFYVEGQLRIVRTITVEQSLYSYFLFIGVKEFNIESAIVTISQMRVEFLEAERHETTKKT